MTRLNNEREQEIRKQQNGPDGCFEIGELLSEIDALRADLKGQCLGMGDDFGDSPIEVIKHLKEDRDQLKIQNEKLQTFYDTHVQERLYSDQLKAENESLTIQLNYATNKMASIVAEAEITKLRERIRELEVKYEP